MAEAQDAGAVEPIDGEDAPDYEFLLDNDRALRCFILKHYGTGGYEIDGRVFVENLKAVYDWIVDGKVPRKKRLQVVGQENPQN